MVTIETGSVSCPFNCTIVLKNRKLSERHVTCALFCCTGLSMYMKKGFLKMVSQNCPFASANKTDFYPIDLKYACQQKFAVCAKRLQGLIPFNITQFTSLVQMFFFQANKTTNFMLWLIPQFWLEYSNTFPRSRSTNYCDRELELNQIKQMFQSA